jgi:drug/metabolite transporter (DMT)-like permease
MIYLPILGAIALASGTVLQKTILKHRNIEVKKYQTLEFLSIVLVMILFVPFFWKASPEAFHLVNILIFLGVVVLSIIANLLLIYSMKWEKVNNLEPAKILEPLFVVLLALLFEFIFKGFSEENTKVIIPAIIAAIALLFSHIKKHHLDFNKYFTAAIIASFFFALELVISNLILEYYSPFTFYFLRCAAIFLITLVIFRPKITEINKKEKIQFAIIGVIWVVLRIIMYYGYTNLGVITTTLILMLGPVMVYVFAKIFLKEKLGWRNIVASIIILGCIAYAKIF